MLSVNTTSLVDFGLTPEQAYPYKIFARDANYNYNPGTSAVATTLAAPAGNPGNPPPPSTNETTNPKPNTSSGGDFSIFTMLIINLFIRRYFSK